VTSTVEYRQFGTVGASIGSTVGGPPKVTKTTKTQTMKGIYSLEGDTLKICFGKDETERPKELTSKNGQTLLVLKRAK
jgi:hypothetical protein